MAKKRGTDRYWGAHGLYLHGEYPENWPAIAQAVKDNANWSCVRCGHGNEREGGYVLTVHHLDGDRANCRWFNLLALCQRCHLHIQGTVNPERPWVFTHSRWFRPYVAGYYAWWYLGELLDRAAVEARIDELLGLEARAVLGCEPIPVEG